jgi:CRP/FNR family transcriptional regulator, cyclic AMP receptor protein
VKSFDWADLFHRHPIFSALNDKEVQELLQDEASKEHNYSAGTTILHAGEVGDSILLIGTGSLDAILPLAGGKQINLSVMRKGEVFGEMGFLEGRPRAATVVAREACTVLEIGGREFRKALEIHPDIEMKLLLTVSERLRQANEQLLNLHLHGIDEKLQLFNTKLDVEHRIVETSLRAAQTVFDQTKHRADEVISSFERTRSLLQITATVIGAIVTVVASGLSYVGYDAIKDIRKMQGEIEKSMVSATTNAKAVSDATQELKITFRQIQETKQTMIQLLSASFAAAIGSNDNEGAKEVYAQLQQLQGLKEAIRITDSSFWRVERQIRSKPGEVDWSELLKAMAENAKAAGTDQTRAYYLLLVNLLLANKLDEFNETLRTFQEVVAEQKRRGVKAHKSNKEAGDRLVDLVTDTRDQRKIELFKKVHVKSP